MNKSLITTALAFFAMLTLFAQASFAQGGSVPQGFNYQAVARDASGILLANQQLAIYTRIVDPDGSTIFQELHSLNTNEFGVFSLVVGQGIPNAGNFATIDWKEGQHELNVLIDDGNGLVNLGDAPLWSVPYALTAEKVTDLSNLTLADVGDINTQNLNTGQVLVWNGVQWINVDAPEGSTIATDETISGNGSIDQPYGISDMGAADGQFLQWTGTVWQPVSLSINDFGDFNTVGVSNGDVLQWDGSQWVVVNISTIINSNLNISTDNTLEGSGTIADPLKLAQQGATNGQVLKWDGTNWIPANDNSGGTGGNYQPGAGIDIAGDIITNTGDLDNTNELQSISIDGNQLSISNGNTITIPTGGTDADADPNNEIQSLELNGDNLSISGSNSVDLSGLTDEVNDADADPNNELQNISINGNQLSISNGNTIVIPTGGTDADADPNNEIQSLELNGNNLSISGSNTIDLSSLQDGVNDADADPNNELQTIQLNGNELQLSNGGGSIVLPSASGAEALDELNDVNTSGASSGQVLKWNGTEWVAANDNTSGGGGGTNYTPGTGINIAGEVISNTGDLSNTNEIQDLELVGNELSISGSNSVDLSPLQDGVNDADADPNNELQNISFAGTTLSISNGNNVNLSSLQDGVNDADADPNNELQNIELNGNQLSISNGNSINIGGVNTDNQNLSISGNQLSISGGNTITIPTGGTDADADPTNEIQDLSISGTSLTISGGNSVDISALQDGVNDADADPNNEIQDISLTGSNLSISGGSTINLSTLPDAVDDADANPTNEIQNLSISGNELSISNGNSISLPAAAGAEALEDLNNVNTTGAAAGQVLKWNGTEWVAANDNTSGGGGGTTYTPGTGISIAGTVISNTGDLDNTNEIQDISLSGTDLSISNGSTIDLATLPDAVDDADADPNNELQNISLTGTNLSISGGNSINLNTLQDGVNDADADPNNEIQNLSISGNQLTISGGNSITIPTGGTDADADPTNEIQDISLTGNQLSISSGSTIDLSTIQDGVNDADADPNNEIQNLSITGNQLSISGGNSISIPTGGTDADADPTNEIQDISLTGNQLSISSGSTIDLSTIQDGVNDADADPNNEIQDISLTGTNLSITGGSSINLGVLQDGTTDADADPNNEIQDISISGNQLSISSGSTLTLPSSSVNNINDLGDVNSTGAAAGQVLKWNGTEWVAANDNTSGGGGGTTYTPGTGIAITGTVISNTGDLDNTNEIQDINLTGTDLSISGGSTIDLSALPDAVNDADADPNNELQNISLTGTNLSISGGNSINLNTLQDGVDDADNNPNNEIQDISLSGTNLSISSGSTVNLSSLQDGVDDADNNPNNEIQALSISGNQLTLNNGGGTVTLPSGGGSSTGWEQGGNTGVIAPNNTIGTNDFTGVSIETNNTVRQEIRDDGTIILHPNDIGDVMIQRGGDDVFDFTILGGDNTNIDGTNINLFAGNATNPANKGGDIHIEPGASFGSSNTGHVYISSGSGNVGVGTGFPPVEKLEVGGGVTVGSTTTNTIGTIQFDSSDGRFKAYNGTTWVNIDETQIPNLDNDSSNEIQNLSISGNQLTLNNGGGTITLPSGGGSTTAWEQGGNSGVGGANNTIGTNDNFGLGLETNGSVRQEITSTGDILFHPNNSNEVVLGRAGDNVQEFTISGGFNSAIDGTDVQIVSGSTATAGSGGDIVLETGNNGGSTDAGDVMIVPTSGGNVGIGLFGSTPVEKLEVNGAVNIGNTSNPLPNSGTIAWDGTNFKGFDGIAWKNLDESGSGGAGWQLGGNSGLSSLTNTIGTNDFNSLRFETDNIVRQEITAFGEINLYPSNGNAVILKRVGDNVSLFRIDGGTNSISSGSTLQLYAGSTSDGTAFGGDVYIEPGTSPTSTSNGNVYLSPYNGGNVAIGSSATPSEKLEVAGGIKLSNTTNSFSSAGTMVWDGTNFKGYDGSTWKNLDATGGGSSGWGLSGNSGTGASNFIGTTDNTALSIRTDNSIRQQISADGEVFFHASDFGYVSLSSPADDATFFSIQPEDNTTIKGTDINIFAGGTTLSGAHGGDVFIGAGNNTSSGNNYGNVYVQSGNMAVGDFSISYTPSEQLEVDGAITLGNTANGSSAAGTMVWDGTNFKGFDGSTWKNLDASGGSAGGWSLSGNSGTSSSDFIGTTDNQSLNFKTNNTNRLTLDGSGNIYFGTNGTSANIEPYESFGNGSNVNFKAGSVSGFSSGNGGSMFINGGLASGFGFGDGHVYLQSATSANVHIGATGLGTPAEKLVVNGAVQVGSSNGSNAGTIEYNSGTGEFRGYNGQNSSWDVLNSSGAFSEGSGAIYYDDGPGSILYTDFVFGSNQYNNNGQANNNHRMIFVPEWGAFRAGVTRGTHYNESGAGIGTFGDASSWDSANLGQYSGGFGLGAVGSGYCSFVSGYLTEASGYLGAVAMGEQSKATGKNGAIALGYYTEANGNSSTAIGQGTVANGVGCVAVGKYNDPVYAAGFDAVGWNPVFIVGNGTSSGSQSNVLTAVQNGNVGIGTDSPGSKLTVVGNVQATCGVLSCSDKRYKKDITPIDGALTKLRQIQGSYYYWKTDQYQDKGFDNSQQIGVIAQELEPLFPNLVHTDADGYKTVDYARFTPILIEAVKEQQQMIDSQQAQIEELKAQKQTLETVVSDLAELKAQLELLKPNSNNEKLANSND